MNLVAQSSSTKVVRLADKDDYGNEDDLKLEISSRAAAAATAATEPTDCDMDALKKVQMCALRAYDAFWTDFHPNP